MSSVNIIYTYDSTISNVKAISGKYALSILVRGQKKYFCLTNNLQDGVRNILNQICFATGKTQLFITISTYHNDDYISIRERNVSTEYLLHVTYTSYERQPTVEEVVGFLI